MLGASSTHAHVIRKDGGSCAQSSTRPSAGRLRAGWGPRWGEPVSSTQGSAGERSRTEVAIVPHTHWDREWCEPFQVFRIRLVGMLDALLALLETDLSYARFLLDGQTSVLDDYLAVRPEAAPRVARLAASGRVQVGPWMILMDEFMVSGETIVRDLQLGLARAN